MPRRSPRSSLDLGRFRPTHTTLASVFSRSFVGGPPSVSNTHRISGEDRQESVCITYKSEVYFGDREGVSAHVSPPKTLAKWCVWTRRERTVISIGGPPASPSYQTSRIGIELLGKTVRGPGFDDRPEETVECEFTRRQRGVCRAIGRRRMRYRRERPAISERMIETPHCFICSGTGEVRVPRLVGTWSSDIDVRTPTPPPFPKLSGQRAVLVAGIWTFGPSSTVVLTSQWSRRRHSQSGVYLYIVSRTDTGDTHHCFQLSRSRVQWSYQTF